MPANEKVAVGLGASRAGADGGFELAGFEVTPKLNLTGAAPLVVEDGAAAAAVVGAAGLPKENGLEGCDAGAEGADAGAAVVDAPDPANPPMRANNDWP